MTKIYRFDACVGRATSGLIRPWKLFKWERLLERIRPAIGVKYLFRFAVKLSLLILLAVCFYSMICPSFASATPTHASTRSFITSSVSTNKAAHAADPTPNPFTP
jgi:hypothetical protein